MKVVIASDHGGYQLKEELKTFIAQLGHEVADYGAHTQDPVDYPDFAFLVAEAVAAGAADRGVMIDGIGAASEWWPTRCLASGRPAVVIRSRLR